MAIANLTETILAFKMRKNQLNLEITELHNQKNLAAYAQGDCRTLEAARKGEVRSKYAEIWEKEGYDTDTTDAYSDYTELPEYEDEIDRIVAEAQRQLDELTAWETAIDTQLTTASTELEEINAYLESYSSKLSANIQEDFNFGLGG